MRTAFALIGALALAACSQAETATDNAMAADEQAAAPSVQAAPQEVGETKADAQPVADAQPLPEIPAQFLGVWDYVEGSCAPESDMRLEITQTQLVFYESVGDIRSFQTEGDTLRVDLAMTGEGERWRALRQLTIHEDGTLHVVDGATPDAVDETPRKRCEA